MIRNECNVMFAIKNFISPLKTDLWLSLETNRWPVWLNAALSIVSKARGIGSTKQETDFSNFKTNTKRVYWGWSVLLLNPSYIPYWYSYLNFG